MASAQTELSEAEDIPENLRKTHLEPGFGADDAEGIQ